jgi:hypothetical protein
MLPGCLGIIKVEPTFKDALDHALEIQPRLPKHIVLIDWDERSSGTTRAPSHIWTATRSCEAPSYLP